MKLGLMSGAFGAKLEIDIDIIRHAESLGFDSAWTAEAYGNDAVTGATWIAAKTEKINVGTAIMQMPARSPAMAAMTAMSLDHLTGGRFILGLGPSGPQVVEGWHGVPYGRPLTRTKEYVEIIRKIIARKEPLSHQGFHYQIPCTGAAASGLGKPLKSILHGNPIKMQLALYIGGMGARDKNFYNDYAKRLGYEEAAAKIQDLFLDGKRGEAIAAVPDALVDDVHLVGEKDRIRDRLAAWPPGARRERSATSTQC
jgi:hypothetical protein